MPDTKFARWECKPKQTDQANAFRSIFNDRRLVVGLDRFAFKRLSRSKSIRAPAMVRSPRPRAAERKPACQNPTQTKNAKTKKTHHETPTQPQWAHPTLGIQFSVLCFRST